MYHYAYLLTFTNGMQYVGAHSTNIDPALDSTYLGSGKSLPKDRHDLRNVDKEILATFSNRSDLMEYERTYIENNECAKSPHWYNNRVATFDRHGSTAWNTGLKGISNTSGPTLSKRYGQGFRTPAQKAGALSMKSKLTGVANPAKAHPSITNCAFVPWYYITPKGEYVEIHDKTKEEMASTFGVTMRQLINRFHHTNMHRQAKYPTLKGYTFGNLPRVIYSAEE